jgi:hypothetical protein
MESRGLGRPSPADDRHEVTRLPGDDVRHPARHQLHPGGRRPHAAIPAWVHHGVAWATVLLCLVTLHRSTSSSGTTTVSLRRRRPAERTGVLDRPGEGGHANRTTLKWPFCWGRTGDQPGGIASLSPPRRTALMTRTHVAVVLAVGTLLAACQSAPDNKASDTRPRTSRSAWPAGAQGHAGSVARDHLVGPAVVGRPGRRRPVALRRARPRGRRRAPARAPSARQTARAEPASARSRPAGAGRAARRVGSAATAASVVVREEPEGGSTSRRGQFSLVLRRRCRPPPAMPVTGRRASSARRARTAACSCPAAP